MALPNDTPDRTQAIRELVFALARDLADEVRATVSDLDLTTTQANVVRDLVSPMTHKELANALACRPSNVTFVVDKLEARGLVERLPHPTDRRSKILRLTKGGHALRTRMISEFEDRSPLSSLTSVQLLQLESLLRHTTSAANV